MAEPVPKRMRTGAFQNLTPKEEQDLIMEFKGVVSESIRAILGRQSTDYDFQATYMANYNLIIIGQAEWICHEAEKAILERVGSIRDPLLGELMMREPDSFVQDLLVLSGGFMTGLKMVADCFAQIDRYVYVLYDMYVTVYVWFVAF
jgi:hypothetical protein